MMNTKQKATEKAKLQDFIRGILAEEVSQFVLDSDLSDEYIVETFRQGFEFNIVTPGTPRAREGDLKLSGFLAIGDYTDCRVTSIFKLISDAYKHSYPDIPAAQIRRLINQLTAMVEGHEE
jgi:hypothetical protein